MLGERGGGGRSLMIGEVVIVEILDGQGRGSEVEKK